MFSWRTWNILSWCLHFSFQTADKLYFVLDCINGGELFYHLQRKRCFLEPQACFYAAEIARALGYLHSMNIVYRDLKPGNILLDSQGHIVLTDFGLCKENVEHNGTTFTFCGTPEYLALEVLHKTGQWTVGPSWLSCMRCYMACLLFIVRTQLRYMTFWTSSYSWNQILQTPTRHLLDGLLQKDRTDRLGAKDSFMEIKNHVFFSLINWNDLINKKITPPFNPNVSGASDPRHFGPGFTEEPVPNSTGRSPDSILITASVNKAAEAFLGFSYVPPMDSFLWASSRSGFEGFSGFFSVLVSLWGSCQLMGHINENHTPGNLAVLLRTACWKLCEEHILLSVSLWGFQYYYSSAVLALKWALEPQTDAMVLLEGRRRSKRDRIFQWSVLAMIVNIPQCAFSDEIVLVPKLFLSQCFSSSFSFVHFLCEQWCECSVPDQAVLL